MYADDTTSTNIYTSSDNTNVDNLETFQDLNTIFKVDKCEQHFTSKIDNINIDRVREFNVLGLILEANLN